MGFFKKKNSDTSDETLIEAGKTPKVDKKPKSDKSIKPRAPKSMAGKKAIRSVFWIFMSLLLLKGVIAFAQGNRTINQTIINGSNDPIVSDSVKGFAADFATEYFTWDSDFVADRSSRLTKFVKGVDSEMGLKTFDVKGSSTVTSSEVYSSKVIDPKHIDVTVVVWRDVLPLPDQLLNAQGKAPKPETIKKKVYMVVPVTLAAEGPVIQDYPRFVTEQQRGDTVDTSTMGTTVGDSDLLTKGKDLADSFLHSWYDGNASQLRYFYSDTVKSPDTIPKSEFIYDKLDKVTVYKNPTKIGEPSTYRIEANVIVKSDIGEPFTNTWKLQVTQKDGRLYVLSNGIEVPNFSKPPTTSVENEPSSSPDGKPSDSNTSGPITSE
ncbi:conjugal transfer protein [Paenibacillus gansuensis]|uniref:Conjugal transfer protein n=1 Tax=Paenibacillus gansuensis TaxID=306542 RepID=A0ABW5PIL9_9BACL